MLENNYFRKIKSTFFKNNCDDWMKYASSISIEHDSGARGTYFVYYNIGNYVNFKVNHLNIAFPIQPTFIWFLTLNGKGCLSPHKDIGPKAVLNYYIKTSDNDETIFHEPKDGILRHSYHPYEKEELHNLCSFTAATNEAYLLNAEEIHSVTKTNVNEERFIVQFSWNDHSYSTIMKMLIDMKLNA